MSFLLVSEPKVLERIPVLQSSNLVTSRILNVLNKYAGLVKKDFEATTATWTEKPNFLVDRRYRGGKPMVEVVTYDKVWHYLNRGTSVRWAVMSNPYYPKTLHGRFWSGSGFGRPVIRGQKAMTERDIGPMPGIHARNWVAYARLKHEDSFVKDISAAVADGIAAAARRRRR